jgi:serine/threonine protein kinase
MLFGVYPFDGTNETEILQKIINQPYKFPNNIISKTCRSIITKLLDKNPNIRLDLNDEILDNWFDEK